MTSLSQFTNQYSLSKTLRFELKPVGATAEWIKKHNIIGNDTGRLVGKDAERATNYKYLKKLLDEMHRMFLEQALSIEPEKVEQQELEQIIKAIESNIANNLEMLSGSFPSILANKTLKVTVGLGQLTERLFNRTFEYWVWQYKDDMPVFWREDIAELDSKIAQSDNNQQIKKLQNAKSKIEKKIAKNELKATNHKGVYSNTESLQLLEWLIRKDKIKLTAKTVGIDDTERELSIAELTSIVRSFDNFATFLDGFSKNRANVYSFEIDNSSKSFHSTSVLYRTFEQNLAFHLANADKWQKITKFISSHQTELLAKGFDWHAELAALENTLDVCLAEFFVSVNFSQSLNQSGIDKYNRVLGGVAVKTGTKKVPGLKEIVNNVRLKLGAKRHQLPDLQFLYKQILSKGDKPFIDAFKNDQEMIVELNAFVSEQIDHQDGAINKIKTDVIEHFASARTSQDVIYIPKDKLTVLSSELTGSWQAINHWRNGAFDQKQLDKQGNKNFFSVLEIQSWLDTEIEEQNFYQAETLRLSKANYDKAPLLLVVRQSDSLIIDALEERVKQLLSSICASAEQYKQLSQNLTAIDKNRDDEQAQGFKQIAIIKSLLDACNNLNHFLSHFTVNRKDKLPEDKADFWYEKLQEYIDQFPIFELYNKVRNHLTKKPFSSEKVKVSFDNSSFLSGWASDYKTNGALIFEFKNDYFLGVVRKKLDKTDLTKLLQLTNKENIAKRFIYDFQKPDNKNIPRLFIRSKGDSFAPAVEKYNLPIKEVLHIYDQGLFKTTHREKNYSEFKTSLKKLIDYFKVGFKAHESYRHYSFCWKPSEEYNDISEFYFDTETSCYTLNEESICFEALKRLVDEEKIYLFQIYNKDFSKNKKSKGKDNLHTSYWKLLFSEENLKDVVLKLNGQAEIFFRKASIPYTDEKRKTGHHAQQLKDKFDYPILKDKRYSVDKFLFHCPITLNFKASGTPYFNKQVQTFLKDNTDVNIIGIDRGEKHLLYISVINQQGDILHQESFNTITNSYQTANGEQREVTTDYHQKLDKSEGKRDKARKSWSTIENIKELKSGYLSHVVHRLAQLIIEHNAIVVLEDLNKGFKRGRFKIEKQVYQKFEKTLIEKLNYLVFKDRESRLQAGHYLNAYQLTSEFKGFKNLKKQSGILFYVNADYTSTTDPITGFIKNVYKRYSSVDDAVAFWQSFDAINYIPEKQRFEFSYDITKLNVKASNRDQDKKQNSIAKTQWTVSSHVTRSQYLVDKETGKGSHQLFVVTDKIVSALNKADIKYGTNLDIKAQLVESRSKQLHEVMMYCFNAILAMRVTDSSKDSGTDENDFILSPVSPYFDSRNNYSNLPENGDANGAYNIARKGIMLLANINSFEPTGKQATPDLLIRNNDWQNFAQQLGVVTEQRKKLSLK